MGEVESPRTTRSIRVTRRHVAAERRRPEGIPNINEMAVRLIEQKLSTIAPVDITLKKSPTGYALTVSDTTLNGVDDHGVFNIINYLFPVTEVKRRTRRSHYSPRYKTLTSLRAGRDVILHVPANKLPKRIR